MAVYSGRHTSASELIGIRPGDGCEDRTGLEGTVAQRAVTEIFRFEPI